jgi:hypothetical protein
MRASAIQTRAGVSSSASEVTILSRLFLTGQRGVRPEVARHILSLSFSAEDKARMHELAVKNQEGTISAEELRELDGYVKAGDLLAILKLKARKLLKRKPQ